MQSESNEKNQHSFIVRIGYEHHPPGKEQWRGYVIHINTGKRMYFLSPVDLLDFISLCLPGFAGKPLPNSALEDAPPVQDGHAPPCAAQPAGETPPPDPAKG